LPARRTGLPLVVHLALAFAAVGCSGLPQPSSLSPIPSQPSIATTRDITEVALEIATGDERLARFLREHPYEVDGVRPSSGDVVDVFVRFDDAVPTSEWPLDVCDITAQNRPMTGVHWRVILSSDRPPAVSPMWGDVSCVSY
jgi:hypothetical protein